MANENVGIETEIIGAAKAALRVEHSDDLCSSSNIDDNGSGCIMAIGCKKA